MMVYVLGFYTLLVGALTAAELKERRIAQRILKPAAAFGFILIALMVGVSSSLYGQLILLGLVACAFGDVFLLSRQSQRLFLVGMVAFALGHFAYLTAFVTLNEPALSLGQIIASAIAILAGIAVFSWLKPHLPDKMRLPVTFYVFIILIMVSNALRLPAQGPLLLAMIGAVLFAVSDVFVGRDRFVSPDPKNALAITPLYFGAQALIALSTQAFS